MAAAGPHMLRSTVTVAVLELQEGSQIGFGKRLYTKVWVSVSRIMGVRFLTDKEESKKIYKGRRLE